MYVTRNLNPIRNYYSKFILSKPAQLAGAVEHTNSISVKGQDSLNEQPGYDAKQSNGELPILDLWGM